MKLITLSLTCTNTIEADTITKELLNNHLVACVKQSSVDSSYWWDGKIESNEEVLLLMDTAESKFEAIDKVVKKIHSYELYVLSAYPIIKTSDKVEKWVKESLQ